MNADEFEKRLLRDLAATPRHDPTAAWKTEILTRAAAQSSGKVITFSRLVVLAWAACWLMALVLRFMTPASNNELFAQAGEPSSKTSGIPWQAFETQRETMFALLASNDSTNPSHP